MIKKIVSTVLLGVAFLHTNGQQQPDTIIVELAKTSRVIFTIKDRKDLETLKHYDFQELFQDILVKFETNDTTALVKNDTTGVPSAFPADEEETEDWNIENHRSNYGFDDDDEDDDDDDYDDDHWNYHGYGNQWGRTWQSFNMDLGTNNYMSNGKFPDSENELYSVRPWGSWYVGLASIQRTKLDKKFFLEWGLGVNWYNFKFQKDNILMIKDDNGTTFVEDTREVNYIKSKLTVAYVTASLIPVVDFGGNNRKARIWEGNSNSFRIGLGPYLSYRIASHSKLVYENGDKEKEKDHDSFYLNTIRYGARLQLGYRSTDLFFNYDFNELFTSGKGPALNAISFGVIF
jgi:hypothetical protein